MGKGAERTTKMGYIVQYYVRFLGGVQYDTCAYTFCVRGRRDGGEREGRRDGGWEEGRKERREGGNKRGRKCNKR